MNRAVVLLFVISLQFLSIAACLLTLCLLSAKRIAWGYVLHCVSQPCCDRFFIYGSNTNSRENLLKISIGKWREITSLFSRNIIYDQSCLGVSLAYVHVSSVSLSRFLSHSHSHSLSITRTSHTAEWTVVLWLTISELSADLQWLRVLWFLHSALF